MATQEEEQREGGDSASTAGAEILSVLGARGIAVADEARQRIQSQEDPATLERWLEKAVIATSIDEVLDNPS